jgi:beta-ribofuranosylaminobenzene 5'-phosphate synthase
MLVLRSFPRIHVCLLDLAGATGRKNGGAGFTLDGFSTIIKVEKAPSTTVTVVGNDEELSEEIKGVIERLQESIDKNLTFLLEIIPPPALHVGLGSKTAVLLGVLEGLRQTFGLQLSPSRLQALSGRGGTSGVGINTFFSGGFVVDGGHPQDGSQNFLPSSARGRGFPIPPLILRADIPSHWRFHLFVPPKGLKWFGRDEIEFFEANTPLPASEVFESIALVYHSIVPAVMQGDLKLLNAGIRGISNIAFKRREIHAQSREVKDLIEALSAYPDTAVGMSSMGPLIYAITNSLDGDFETHAKHLMEHTDCGYLGTFAGRNGGFEVEHD